MLKRAIRVQLNNPSGMTGNFLDESQGLDGFTVLSLRAFSVNSLRQ